MDGTQTHIKPKTRLKRGWNQDKEAKKVDERSRERNKKAGEARSKIGQVVALQAQAQQRQAQSLALTQMQGMDMVATATAAKAIAQANENKPAAKAGANAAKKGKWAKLLASSKNIKQLARRIERLNNGLFDVTELEGFQGVGEITGGHSSTSDHYKGEAFDVSTTRRNNSPFETRKLKRLMKAIRRADLPTDQQFGAWNDPEDHPTHYHQSFQTRGGWR